MAAQRACHIEIQEVQSVLWNTSNGFLTPVSKLLCLSSGLGALGTTHSMLILQNASSLQYTHYVDWANILKYNWISLLINNCVEEAMLKNGCRKEFRLHRGIVANLGNFAEKVGKIGCQNTWEKSKNLNSPFVRWKGKWLTDARPWHAALVQFLSLSCLCPTLTPEAN